MVMPIVIGVLKTEGAKRLFAVTQTPVENHQLILVWKNAQSSKKKKKKKKNELNIIE